MPNINYDPNSDEYPNMFTADERNRMGDLEEIIVVVSGYKELTVQVSASDLMGYDLERHFVEEALEIVKRDYPSLVLNDVEFYCDCDHLLASLKDGRLTYSVVPPNWC